MFLLAGCDSLKKPAVDTSVVDTKLEEIEPLGNSAITNDITANSNKKNEEEAMQNISLDGDLELQTERSTTPTAPTPVPTPLPTVNELQIQDLVVGKGIEASSSAKVTVHYTGTLTNGQVFDSSVSRGEPFTFTLGVGQVIAGWDQGVKGMKVGGKRKLIIPAHLAYGDRGAGSIPPGATLVFEVELLKVE